MELAQIQEQARCNWCRNPLNVAGENVTEQSFVDTGKRFGDGSNATALYCSNCLADPDRVSRPKSAINRNNLDEINIDDLPTATAVPTPEEQAPAEEQPAI